MRWTIGQMAKGVAVFDQGAARAASAAIGNHAAAVPELFEAQEDDPKSEAKALIWTDFDDFTAKAAGLENVAFRLSKSISGADDLPGAIKSLGETCQSCHKAYRE